MEGARKKGGGKGEKGRKKNRKKERKTRAVLYAGFFKPSNGKTECLTSAKQIEAEAFQPATLNRFDGMAQRCYRFDFVPNIPGEMFERETFYKWTGLGCSCDDVKYEYTNFRPRGRETERERESGRG